MNKPTELKKATLFNNLREIKKNNNELDWEAPICILAVDFNYHMHLIEILNKENVEPSVIDMLKEEFSEVGDYDNDEPGHLKYLNTNI